MTFSINEEGAKYSVDAASVNDFPRGDVAENLNEQISLQGDNPGQLLKDLSDKLLKRDEASISIRKSLADQYEFTFTDNAQQIATTDIKVDEYTAPNNSAPKNKEKEEKVTATEKTNHTPSKKLAIDYEKGTGITTTVSYTHLTLPTR